MDENKLNYELVMLCRNGGTCSFLFHGDNATLAADHVQQLANDDITHHDFDKVPDELSHIIFRKIGSKRWKKVIPTRPAKSTPFTPGEWIVEERNGNIFIEAIGVDSGESTAVEVCRMHGNEAIDKADAALISQAPKLYEVCRQAAFWFGDEDHYPVGSDGFFVVENIRAIINKVTGDK